MGGNESFLRGEGGRKRGLSDEPKANQKNVITSYMYLEGFLYSVPSYFDLCCSPDPI